MHDHLLTTRAFRRLPSLLVALCAFMPPAVKAGAPSSAPQVLFAITNSQSMDGTTAGAIMVGSGSLGTAASSLTSSSSPSNYAVPSGFTPPLNAGSNGSAPYTVTCNTSYRCDNGPSRMNFTKAAIASVISRYGSSINFGLYTYKTGSPTLYNTWVYYMSASGGFTFTNTSSSSTVVNPCYAYASGSSSVQSTCASVAAQYASGTVASSMYVTIGATSDDPLINDVYYGTGSSATVLTYGTVSPANPYTYYPLSTYNNDPSNYSVSYSKTAPNIGSLPTTPTNAGYVPFSDQVLYAERGFGFGATQQATTGTAQVAMGTDPTSSTAFTTALAPETNNASSSEIKSLAGQSAIYGLMNGAKSYLSGLSTASCQGQYVVLLTDGLPTLDKSGKAWPPVGTAAANAYNLSATYNVSGSFASSNSQAVTDAIAAITALRAAGISVYVVGLGAGVDATKNPAAASLLQAMAIAGGTNSYYAADNVASLTAAFSTIINQIYSESSVAAPVAPLSVGNGSSYEYELTSVASPAAGHVKAYKISSGGIAAATETWDAASLMTTSTRTTALMAAKSDNSIVTLGNVEPAAFSLAATTCVPNVATLIAYTITPSYSYNSCNYLAGRDPASLLGPFSSQNTGRYAGPPTSSLLIQKYPTYKAYAKSVASRTPMLMFSNKDGFIYAVNASSGALLWGWTSRNLLAKMQAYSTFETLGLTDGNFTVVDAMDGQSNWGTYLVGSLQSGAEHFSVKLNASGVPSTLVYDTVIANGSSAGDKAGATGTTPLRQPPVIAYIGNAAYQVHVVTVGTTSTLYETNVATGATTSATLAFTVTSALTLNAGTNQLYLGSSAGTVWIATLTTGTAASDIALIQKVGTTVTPSNGNALANVLYVGYAEVAGVPYLYALNAAELTVWGVTSAGWTPLWASTPSAGYVYRGTTWYVSSTVTALTTGSIVSDIPALVGGSLLVPTYVAGSGCSAGTGYYDFFNLASGAFPTSLALTLGGATISADLNVGAGPAFTPSFTQIASGVSANPGTQGSTTPQTPLIGTGNLGAKPISWRQF